MRVHSVPFVPSATGAVRIAIMLMSKADYTRIRTSTTRDYVRAWDNRHVGESWGASRYG